MSLVWRALKKAEKERLRRTNCDQIAVEVRSEPVRRKVRTRTAHRRRIVAFCLSCRSPKTLAYGDAFGRKTEAGRR